MPGVDTPVEREDLPLKALQMVAKCFQALARNLGNASIVWVGNTTSEQLLDAITAY